MHIGIGTVELRLYEGASLKEKRAVIRSLTARLRQSGTLSVAEVGYQDKWQRALLGLAVAAADEDTVHRSFHMAAEIIEKEHRVELIRFDEEIEPYDTDR